MEVVYNNGLRRFTGIVVLLLANVLAFGGASDLIPSIQTLVEAGNLADARTALDQSLQSQPQNAALWNLLGIVNAQENKPEAAQQAFEKAVKLAPRLKSAWLNLGRLYAQNEDAKTLAKGVAAYDTVLRLDPANAEAHHQQALLLLWTGSFNDSLKHLDQLPATDRTSRSATAVRCADEAALGHTASALAAADRLLQIPDLTQADVLAVLPAIQSRNEAVEQKLLAGLQTRGLAGTELLLRLAKIQEAQKDLTAARNTYEQAFRLTNSAQTLVDLARVANQQKDFEGALGFLAHARDLEPQNAMIHFYFGLTCNELKLPFEARTSLKKALDLAPEDPVFTYAMGALQLQWADKSLAAPYLQKFVELRPQDARGHLALATAYFGADRNKEAKSELQLAERDNVTRAGAKYLLGRIAQQDGNPEQAIAYFTEVAALQPKSPEVHADLAALFFDKQDFPAAMRETGVALALDPKNYEANRIQLRLYQQSKDPRTADQIDRMKHITQNRDAELALLQRSIGVSPW